MFRLATHVKHLTDLQKADYSHFDDFYLGDYSCLGSRSLSADVEALGEAVGLLKRDGKKVYVSPVAFPITRELPLVHEFLSRIENLPIDGIELSSVGLVDRVLRDPRNRWEVHVGTFGNVYTDATARTLKQMGVTRVFANPELSLEELLEIQDNADLDVVFQIHGKLPLTPTVPCIFKHTTAGFECSEHRKDTDKKQVLRTSRWPENHVLLCYGKLMVSGRDCCMIDHLDRLKQGGARYFYINTMNESPEYIQTISRVYREALVSVFGGKQFDIPAARSRLEKLSPFGFANGFYFGAPGFRYVPSDSLAAGKASLEADVTTRQ